MIWPSQWTGYCQESAVRRFGGDWTKGWHCSGIQHTQPKREHVCWLHLRFAMAISAKDRILAKYSTFAMAILASSPVVAFPCSILCRFPKGFSASASLGFLWEDPSFDFFTEKLMEPSPKPCQVLEQLVQQLVRRVGEASLASFDPFLDQNLAWFSTHTLKFWTSWCSFGCVWK